MTQLGADVRVAAVDVAAASLGEQGLAAHTAQIVGQRRELVVHAVGDALGRRAALAVEILMRLVDELARRPVTIDDARQRRGRIVLEAADGVVVGAGQEDHLCLGAVVADGVDDLLDGGGPGRHVEVVRLVHDAEDDVGLRCVFLGELGPEVGELVVGRSALADDAAVPSGVVVHVDDAERAGRKARLHDLVVGTEEVCVQRASEVVVDEVLPSDRNAEEVELVILGKVLHLRGSNRAWAIRASGISLWMFSINLHLGVG